MKRAALALAILAWAPRPAEACTSAFDRAIVGAPKFEPADAVTIRSEDVAVQCDEDYTCTVISTFAIAVASPARATVIGSHMTALSLGSTHDVVAAPIVADSNDRASITTELAVTQTQLVLRARVDVVPFVDGCFTDGVIARHPYLGSARASNEHVLQIDTSVVPRVKAPESWDLLHDARPASQFNDVATTRLWFTVPGRTFTHGGALLLIGASSGAGRIFRVRGGWEVAIGKPWLVFGLVGETDFAAAWNVALTAESTSRAWVLPLSLGGGAGVVLADGTRPGGRAQISVALGAVRVMLSCDLIEGRDTRFETSIAGLIGGSL